MTHGAAADRAALAASYRPADTTGDPVARWPGRPVG